MKKTIAKRHLSIDIQGFLNHYYRRSMKGLMLDDDGRLMTDKEVRAELKRHLSLGHTVLPMCDEKECPDFDYFGGGCPGHDIHYYDDDGNEILKEEYEKKGGEQ